MTKAEERAMEVYPPRMAYNSMVSVALKEKRDVNANNRQKFIQGYVTAEQDLTDKAKFSSGWDGFFYGRGYNQAEQDLMEKAKRWFTDNIPSEKVQLLWSEFEQFITD